MCQIDGDEFDEELDDDPIKDKKRGIRRRVSLAKYRNRVKKWYAINPWYRTHTLGHHHLKIYRLKNHSWPMRKHRHDPLDWWYGHEYWDWWFRRRHYRRDRLKYLLEEEFEYAQQGNHPY
jgi:hypothetical protein